MKKIAKQSLWSVVGLVVFMRAAYAYLDPVTGSFILQGIVGGIAALMVGFRSFRKKVASFFKSKNKTDE